MTVVEVNSPSRERMDSTVFRYLIVSVQGVILSTFSVSRPKPVRNSVMRNRLSIVGTLLGEQSQLIIPIFHSRHYLWARSNCDGYGCLTNLGRYLNKKHAKINNGSTERTYQQLISNIVLSPMQIRDWSIIRYYRQVTFTSFPAEKSNKILQIKCTPYRKGAACPCNR